MFGLMNMSLHGMAMVWCTHRSNICCHISLCAAWCTVQHPMDLQEQTASSNASIQLPLDYQGIAAGTIDLLHAAAGLLLSAAMLSGSVSHHSCHSSRNASD